MKIQSRCFFVSVHVLINQKKSHLSYQLAPAVHAQVEIGFFAPDSHLATKGIGLHYELGL